MDDILTQTCHIYSMADNIEAASGRMLSAEPIKVADTVATWYEPLSVDDMMAYFGDTDTKAFCQWFEIDQLEYVKEGYITIGTSVDGQQGQAFVIKSVQAWESVPADVQHIEAVVEQMDAIPDGVTV